MVNKKTFALFGFGHIGRRHAAALAGHPEAQLVAVADPTLPDTGGLPCYGEPEALLAAHPDVEVVIVATPNGLHEAQAVLALAAGKHVVIEKPMALSRAGCEHILDQALRQGRQVFCVMQNRFSPVVQSLRHLVQSGALGQIFTVNVGLYWNRDDRYYTPGSWHGSRALDGGPLFTQFAHYIDLLYHLFGRVEPTHATFRNFSHRHSTEFEDTGWVEFSLGQGAQGSLFYTTAVPQRNFESTITIVGEKGMVKVGGQYMDRLEYLDGAEAPPVEAPAGPSPHYQVLQNVLDVLNGQGSIHTNALEGLKVVEIIESMYKLQRISVY